MKPLKVIVAGMAIVFASATQAQVSINVNIGARPAWGPVVESDVRYYYLPEVEAYYDIPSSMFIYLHDGRWIHRRHLPERYCNYDLHRGRKIVISDYRGNAPYSHCRYPEYRQVQIRDCDRYNDERPGRGYNRDNDRRSCDVSYRENDNEHDHGRGHAYGRYKKGWRD